MRWYPHGAPPMAGLPARNSTCAARRRQMEGGIACKGVEELLPFEMHLCRGRWEGGGRCRCGLQGRRNESPSWRYLARHSRRHRSATTNQPSSSASCRRPREPQPDYQPRPLLLPLPLPHLLRLLGFLFLLPPTPPAIARIRRRRCNFGAATSAATNARGSK